MEPLPSEIRLGTIAPPPAGSSRAAQPHPSPALRAFFIGLSRSLDRLAAHRTTRALTLVGAEVALALAAAIAATAPRRNHSRRLETGRGPRHRRIRGTVAVRRCPGCRDDRALGSARGRVGVRAACLAASRQRQPAFGRGGRGDVPVAVMREPARDPFAARMGAARQDWQRHGTAARPDRGGRRVRVGPDQEHAVESEASDGSGRGGGRRPQQAWQPAAWRAGRRTRGRVAADRRKVSSRRDRDCDPVGDGRSDRPGGGRLRRDAAAVPDRARSRRCVKRALGSEHVARGAAE